MPPTPPPEDDFARAMDLTSQGQHEEALDLLRAATQRAELRLGPDHRDTARAFHQLGMVLSLLGRLDDAADAYRRASRLWDPTDADATREHLTYALNLGDLLTRLGHLDEAEDLLRRGLARREAFYGRQHAGYAFGLEPLITLLVQRRALKEALLAADTLVANLWNNTHPRITAALALRAEILRRGGYARHPFDGLEPLPDEVFAQALTDTLRRAEALDRPDLAWRLRLDVLHAALRRPVLDLPERVPEALHDPLWALVAPLLPEDLLDDLAFDLTSQDLRLHLLREPTPEEALRLQRARDAALRALQLDATPEQPE